MWLTFRPMEKRDLKRVLEMRNHPVVRRACASSTKEITMKEHQKWWRSSIDLKLVCLINGTIRGVVTLKPYTMNRVEWSFYTDQSARGLGTGGFMLEKLLQSLNFSFPLVSSVIARVKKTNVASVKLHKRLGFIKIGSYWVRRFV